MTRDGRDRSFSVPALQTSVAEERRIPGRPGSAGLEALFAPRGIAVIGASASPGKLGAAMARSLESFPGAVLLVNDRRPDPSAGFHRSVADAVEATGSPADLAILCVPAPATAAALLGAARAGVKAALVCAGGFAEAGGPGIALQAGVADVVRDTGIRLLGPNTSGFLVPGSQLVASFVPGADTIPAGNITLVAGSGGILHAVAFQLATAGLGLHLGVGIGNGLDVTAADVLDHVGHRHLAGTVSSNATNNGPSSLAAKTPSGPSGTSGTSGTSGPSGPPAGGRVASTPIGPVALHVEGVTDGRRLAEAVARLTPHVPVVCLVVGRTDVGDFARSHTGALTPSWRTARAVLRDAGAVLVDDDRELVDALVALSAGRLAPSADPGVGLVTGQAGPAVLFADRLKTAGVTLPALQPATTQRLAELLPALTHQGNPVDTGRPGETFTDVLAAVGTDPAIDLLAVYALLEPGAFDLTAAVHASADRNPPVVVATGGPAPDVTRARTALSSIGVAAYDGVAGAVAGVRALVDDARAQAARAADGPAVRLVLPEGFTVPVGEHEGKQLLTWLGIATPRRVACTTRADAHAALAELLDLGTSAEPRGSADVQRSVVVKMLEPVVLHKARVGGVRLGVQSAADIDAALDALDAAGARRYLVEETAPPGLDFIVGARRDPVFGPIVLLGLGGDLAEALDTVEVRPAPLSREAASAMIDDLLAEAVPGAPGGAPPDQRVYEAALAAAVTAIGAFLAAAPEVDEIEINPLRVTGDGGLIALDVVVVGRDTVLSIDDSVLSIDDSPAALALSDGQGGS